MSAVNLKGGEEKKRLIKNAKCDCKDVLNLIQGILPACQKTKHKYC